MSAETIRDDFAYLDDWEDRYRYVIELGRKLPPLPEQDYTEANKVQGCASQVWLTAETDRTGGAPVMRFHGDSDAHIVKGLLAILLELCSGKSADEVLSTDAHAFFRELGLEEHLSAQRANGLASMVKTMKAHAMSALTPG